MTVKEHLALAVVLFPLWILIGLNLGASDITECQERTEALRVELLAILRESIVLHGEINEMLREGME